MSSNSFQSIIQRLNQYWHKHSCALLLPYDVEAGAGTFHTATTLYTLGNKPWRCAYVQPSRRPVDARYGEHPNRLYKHHQYQVILKPTPLEIQDLYLESLAIIGIDSSKHDIRFVEDDWESPSLGASGLGWEVWCDGMEISQFTYMQQMGGIECSIISGELTYGLERIALYIQEKDNVFDLDYNEYNDPKDRLSYGDIFKKPENEYAQHIFDNADVEFLRQQFNNYERQSQKLVDASLALPAYEYCIKANHIFNMLDASGAISVTERASYIGRIRQMAKSACEQWAKI